MTCCSQPLQALCANQRCGAMASRAQNAVLQTGGGIVVAAMLSQPGYLMKVLQCVGVSAYTLVVIVATLLFAVAYARGEHLGGPVVEEIAETVKVSVGQSSWYRIPLKRGHRNTPVTKLGEIGLPGGLPPPRPPGPGASGANRGGAAFGRRPPILGTPVGAGGARSGGSGGREPPRKASPPELCYLAVLVASCNTQNM